MTPFRKALVMLLAFALVLGAPASGVAMPAAGDCNWSPLAAHQGADCGNASNVSGCDLLCASSPSAPAEPYACAETSSLAPYGRSAFPPAAHARAPDTAPPKPAA